MSLYFSAVNLNKRSITLNLKSSKGIEVAKQLVAESELGWVKLGYCTSLASQAGERRSRESQFSTCARVFTPAGR